MPIQQKGIGDLTVSQWQACCRILQRPELTSLEVDELLIKAAYELTDEEVDVLDLPTFRALRDSLLKPLRRHYCRSLRLGGKKYRLYYNTKKLPVERADNISRIADPIEELPLLVANLLQHQEPLDEMAEKVKAAPFREVYPIFRHQLVSFLTFSKNQLYTVHDSPAKTEANENITHLLNTFSNG